MGVFSQITITICNAFFKHFSSVEEFSIWVCM